LQRFPVNECTDESGPLEYGSAFRRSA